MNNVVKIEPQRYPKYRRRRDRAEALALSISQVERLHSGRMRRMKWMLGVFAALLFVNAIIVINLG